jgi:hypothetical protein
MHMHPILLAWLVALILHAAVGSATVAMMGDGDCRADAAALSQRQPGDHRHCYRFRRHWLHDRHRFALLAGKTVLRRNPERNVQILYNGNIYRVGRCAGWHIPAFFII